ncbi:MAG: serine/threonine-protein phosphatase [Sphingomonadales bacterium]|nr:MAG: serine/threonine-protein phosphatase [Sphingomonadales bacterium]
MNDDITLFYENIHSWLMPAPRPRSSNGVPSARPTVCISTDIGARRSENQDRLALMSVRGVGTASAFTCAVLVDGMGGLPNGEKSAVAAISRFLVTLVQHRRVEPAERLRRAVLAGDQEVYQIGLGGGATLSAVLMEQGRVHWVNVGDSRIYRAKGEKLARVTIDDTLEEAFGGTGVGLLQFLGMGSAISPHVGSFADEFDFLLLTTDGIHRIGDSVIGQVSAHASSSVELAHRLTDIALYMGGPDNASLVTIERGAVSASYAGAAEVTVWSPERELQLKWIRAAPAARLEPERPLPSAEPPIDQQPARPSPRRSVKKRPPKSGKPSDDKKQLDIGFKDAADEGE